MGHPVSEATRRKIGLGNTGVIRSPETRQKIRVSLAGRKQSPIQGHKKRLYWTGEGNPRWKGGITPLVLKIRHCLKYREWRIQVFRGNDYTCQQCGKRGGDLEADHYPKRFADIMSSNLITVFEDALTCEELWDVNNGRTMCKPCHRPTIIKSLIKTNV